jgi:hypothetical protein
VNYAIINRKEWEQKGEEMVRKYLEEYYEKYANDDEQEVEKRVDC